MKLQKLLYYVKVWTVVAGKKIVSPYDGFYAWKYGPVNPGIYGTYKKYGNKPIDLTPPVSSLQGDEKQMVDFVLDSYSFYNAITLSKTTHTEEPWIKNKDSNGRIKDHEIKEYYSKESFAKNFPLGSSNKYYPPKTSGYYSYVFDMNRKDKATRHLMSLVAEPNHFHLDRKM